MAPAVASGQYHKTILTYIYSHFFKARLYSNIHNICCIVMKIFNLQKEASKFMPKSFMILTPGLLIVTNVSAMDKLKLTGRNLGQVYNSKLRHASVFAIKLHT